MPSRNETNIDFLVIIITFVKLWKGERKKNYDSWGHLVIECNVTPLSII